MTMNLGEALQLLQRYNFAPAMSGEWIRWSDVAELITASETKDNKPLIELETPWGPFWVNPIYIVSIGTTEAEAPLNAEIKFDPHRLALHMTNGSKYIIDTSENLRRLGLPAIKNLFTSKNISKGDRLRSPTTRFVRSHP